MPSLIPFVFAMKPQSNGFILGDITDWMKSPLQQRNPTSKAIKHKSNLMVSLIFTCVGGAQVLNIIYNILAGNCLVGKMIVIFVDVLFERVTKLTFFH